MTGLSVADAAARVEKAVLSVRQWEQAISGVQERLVEAHQELVDARAHLFEVFPELRESPSPSPVLPGGATVVVNGDADQGAPMFSKRSE